MPMIFHKHRNTTLVAAYNVLVSLRFYLPFLILYLTEVSGSFTVGMSVLSLQTFMIAFLEIPTGLFSDRVGRKLTLVYGTLSMTLGVAAYAIAQYQGAIFLFVGAILLALSKSLFSGNNKALIYDTLKDKQKEKQFHHYIGQLDALKHLGAGLASIIGTILLLWVPIGGLISLSIIPIFMALIIGLFIEEPKGHKDILPVHPLERMKNAIKNIYHNPRLMALTVAQSISHGLSEASWQFRAAFIKAVWPVWAIGILNMVDHIVAVVGYWFGARLIDKFKHRFVITCYEALNSMLQSVAVLVQNMFSPICFLVPGLLWGAFKVAKEDALQQEYSNTERATMGSVSSFWGNIVYGLAAILIGAVADATTPAIALLVAAVIQALSIPVYAKAFRT